MFCNVAAVPHSPSFIFQLKLLTLAPICQEKIAQCIKLGIQNLKALAHCIDNAIKCKVFYTS